jgi:hypothetical protein
MRSVNEGIAFFASDLEPSDPGEPDRWLFVCECGGAECVEWVELELAAYAAIRGREADVVADGHAVVHTEPVAGAAA